MSERRMSFNHISSVVAILVSLVVLASCSAVQAQPTQPSENPQDVRNDGETHQPLLCDSDLSLENIQGVPRCFGYSARDDAFACLAAHQATRLGWEVTVAVELVSIGRTEELWVLDENLTKGGKTVLEHDHALVSLDAVNGQLAAAGYVALSTKAEPVVPSELFSIGPEGESLEVLKAVDDGDEYFQLVTKCSSGKSVLLDTNLALQAWVYPSEGNILVALKEARNDPGELEWHYHFLSVDAANCGYSPR